MYLSREKLIKVLLVLFIFGLCIAVVGVILNGVKQFRIGSQLSSMSQVSSLSHVLVRQQANLFALMLAKNTKTEELNAALDSFAQEDFILDANLYSPSGQLLAQNQNALELKKSLLNPDTQQIVEPVLVKSELAGFLRVTFDSQYIKNTNDKIGAMFRQLYGFSRRAICECRLLFVPKTENCHSYTCSPNSRIKPRPSATLSSSPSVV